jgi:hypothetical protein
MSLSSSLRALRIRATTRVAVTCLAVLLLAFPPRAQRASTEYIFLLASGCLCDAGESSTCPATAKGAQGDSYELSGAGTFDVQTKSVKGAGT